jgi:hypothetical protein
LQGATIVSTNNIWLGKELWPSGRSTGDFGRDIFRLENYRTNKQRAMANCRW